MANKFLVSVGVAAAMAAGEMRTVGAKKSGLKGTHSTHCKMFPEKFWEKAACGNVIIACSKDGTLESMKTLTPLNSFRGFTVQGGDNQNNQGYCTIAVNGLGNGLVTLSCQTKEIRGAKGSDWVADKPGFSGCSKNESNSNLGALKLNYSLQCKNGATSGLFHHPFQAARAYVKCKVGKDEEDEEDEEAHLEA